MNRWLVDGLPSSSINFRPVVGLTPDLEQSGGYASVPWYALRHNYCQALEDAGCVPIVLPHSERDVDRYLGLIDGLVVTGGAFDLDPTLYGEDSRHPAVTTKQSRTRFELLITRGALARDLPILGICGGQQLLAVELGATLYQHLPDEVPGALAHEQTHPRDIWGHTVELTAGTLLHRIAGTRHMKVNSAHHQAVKSVPHGVTVSARSPDGVIEAIEAANKAFCLGVQWHPEYHVDPGDKRIMLSFADAARTESRIRIESTSGK